MARRSFWRRVAETGFNLEQFRSELADEAQLAAALPENVRVKSLRRKAERELNRDSEPQPPETST
ncbi:MAG: hypothetical protein ACM3ZA_03730 [Bacillota bacterium]